MGIRGINILIDDDGCKYVNDKGQMCGLPKAALKHQTPGFKTYLEPHPYQEVRDDD